jgi:cytochrome P450
MTFRIQQITARLMEPLVRAGTFDFIQAVAIPLPLLVIADLLGVPDHDQNLLKQWSHAMVAGIDRRRSADTASVLSAANRATLDFSLYLKDAIRVRRKRPQDDLLGMLIRAQEAGNLVSEDELVSMCILLLNAGHETTTNLLGNGLLALLQHPEQLALLRAEPHLAGQAIEELLRYDAPVQWTSRRARADMTLGDIATIRRGEDITLVLGSANRDESMFADPDSLNIRRAERSPLTHLAFGHGIHFCLGAPLARLEGRIRFQTITQRMPGIALHSELCKWNGSVIFRGLSALLVDSGH